MRSGGDVAGADHPPGFPARPHEQDFAHVIPTYYFRTTLRFETAHPAYAFLNRIVAVASGDRRPEGPIYTVHEVL